MPIFAFAHPGKTDASGGHWDHSAGEYHYHHGYPAHEHSDTNGDGIPDCPYQEITAPSTEYTLPPVPTFSVNRVSPVATSVKSSAVSPVVSESPAKPNTSDVEPGTFVGFAVLLIFAGFLVFHFSLRISSKKEREIAALQQKIRCQSKEVSQLQEKLRNAEAELHNAEAKLQAGSLAEAKSAADKKLLESNLAELASKLANIGALIGSESVRKADAMPALRLPVGIVFENGVPVKGTRTKEKPYGDYTVYVSRNSKKYHKNIGCSNSWKSTMHLYSLPDNFAPCSICNPLPLPSEEDRQWYRDIVNAYNLLNKNKSV